MMNMQIDVWCRTDVGRKRESNQDSYLINKDLGLYIVADGMGGHSGGEVASSMAVQTIEEIISAPPIQDLPARELLIHAYSEASRRIYARASSKNRELLGMGTTMVLLYRYKDKIFIGNVGDSRCYLFRAPHLWQVTEDHSVVNEQLRAGLLKEDQLKTFSAKNVITRSVGYEPDVVVDVLERTLQSGDIFILCSDGLSGLVSDKEICEIFQKNSAEEAVKKCVDKALQNGGDDNVTVLAAQVL